MRLVATALLTVAFAACSGPASDRAASVRATDRAASHPAASAPADASGRHTRNDCSRQSGADFPGAFTDRSNVVVGPLALVGAAYTDPQTVREYGGNKFPALVRAGHTVTVRLAPDARAIAGLAYGPLPEGETKMRDTYRSVTFVACRPGNSLSHADGEEVTFWSGFVLTRMPVCLPLDVEVDGGPPRRVAIALGQRC